MTIATIPPPHILPSLLTFEGYILQVAYVWGILRTPHRIVTLCLNSNFLSTAVVLCTYVTMFTLNNTIHADFNEIFPGGSMNECWATFYEGIAGWQQHWHDTMWTNVEIACISLALPKSKYFWISRSTSFSDSVIFLNFDYGIMYFL